MNTPVKSDNFESPRCSFCRSPPTAEAWPLASADGVAICRECLAVGADDVLQNLSEERLQQQRRAWVDRRARLRDERSVCGLCGQVAIPDEMLVIEKRGLLCGACADAVEDALAQGRASAGEV